MHTRRVTLWTPWVTRTKYTPGRKPDIRATSTTCSRISVLSSNLTSTRRPLTSRSSILVDALVGRDRATRLGSQCPESPRNSMSCGGFSLAVPRHRAACSIRSDSGLLRNQPMDRHIWIVTARYQIAV